MAKGKLDPNLLAKMADKSKKQPQYLREQISRRAGRMTISSLAAQILWAREMEIGITVALRRADGSVRQEVQRASVAGTSSLTPSTRARIKPSASKRARPDVAAAVDFLLEDMGLRGRCRDLLLAKTHYDRVVREATTVLDDRLKTVSGISNMNPGDLVGKALNPDPNKAVVVVSNEKSEQQGFFSICSGVMLAFRNKAHHSLSEAFTQREALKFCGFVDALLAVIGKASIHPERI
jgi:uncharacterized protein (TIGR02391 family)